MLYGVATLQFLKGQITPVILISHLVGSHVMKNGHTVIFISP